MAITLRPYQAEAKEAILQEWSEGRKRTLLVLPTGCGKTVVLAKVAEDQVEHGGRVLIMAHRGELLDQAADKVKQVTGIDCAYEKAGASSLGSWMPITVGSVQSLCQEKRLQQFPPNYYSSVIVDEAHHCLSDSYQRVLEHFADANVLGVTATPDRGDMRNLGRFFDSRAYEYTMSQAIREKYLCPVKAQMIPLKLDISDVGVSNGDYNVGEIGTALEPYLRQIAHEIAENYAARKTVVFLPLIHISQTFAGYNTSEGFLYAHAEVMRMPYRKVGTLEACWYMLRWKLKEVFRMPRFPDHPCKHPGCSRLVPKGKKYCDEHAGLHPEDTRSAAARGYGSRWQHLSKQYLRAHPLCVECKDCNTYERFVMLQSLKEIKRILREGESILKQNNHSVF